GLLKPPVARNWCAARAVLLCRATDRDHPRPALWANGVDIDLGTFNDLAGAAGKTRSRAGFGRALSTRKPEFTHQRNRVTQYSAAQGLVDVRDHPGRELFSGEAPVSES